MEQKNLILGFDFGEKYSQFCCYDRGTHTAVSIPVKEGEEAVEFPTAIAKKRILRTKTVKVGNTIYYCTEKGILEAWKKGKTIYYPNGKKMNSTKAYEYETLQRAKDVVSKITKPSMSKSEKFETCFRWVMYQHYYDTRRIFYNQTAWPALYANDYLILSGKGGDCFSDACSFAYLAKALGYKNVYVCVDTTATDGSGHCWAEIGGRVYDPLFAEAKSYYGYFGVGYGSYGLYPERRVAV